MTDLGGYYHNSLKADASRLRAELKQGEARSKTLHRIGSSCMADHNAAMSVKRRMLDVVEQARASSRVRQAPPFATDKGLQFFAQDSDGQWFYVNHAGTWQGCPPPFAKERR